jgi:hypothetical protein
MMLPNSRFMSPSGHAAEAAGGTRFLLYPQLPTGPYDRPELVRLSPRSGMIGPGPEDDEIYVIDPVNKPEPYGVAIGSVGRDLFMPPWTGLLYPPALPDAHGHFDHLDPASAEFEAAHVYGVTRFVLDIWDRYFGYRIPWHFAADRDRLEIVLLRYFDNATAGYGFIEVGGLTGDDGVRRPFSLNFDILAHEVAHLIIYSVVGLPELDRHVDRDLGDYFGFHESAADMVALISALHFESVIDDLLEETGGNLYSFNHLIRFGETSAHGQIRLASNGRRMAEFIGGWSSEHALSEPLTGALFDSLVDIFHERLLAHDLIGSATEDLADVLQRDPAAQELLQRRFDEAYVRHPEGFKTALIKARDDMARLLAATWSRLRVDDLTYHAIGDTILAADLEDNDGRYQRLLYNNFRWRQIYDVPTGPRLAPPDAESHAFSVRTLRPGAALP